MFKKIISNLSFSPALIWQLSSYSKKIRREKTLRKLSLVFMIMLIIVQLLTIFQAPESTNSSNPNDMILGGVGSSKDNILASYDSNSRNFKDILNYVGITKNDLSSIVRTDIKTKEKLIWGLSSLFGYNQGERLHFANSSSDQKQIINFYSRPTKELFSVGTNINGWVGKSPKIGWFGIAQSSGALLTDSLPSSYKDCGKEYCSSSISKSITATNISQGILDASSINATASDQISYTISLKNNGSTQEATPAFINIYDITEYSSLFDAGGGTLDKESGILSWPDITLDPNTEQTRTFVIRLKDQIPPTPRGSSNPTSYDCKIMTTFGNSISINLDCPVEKTIEVILTSLPNMGSDINILFSVTISFIVIFLYLRANQLKKETHLVRKDTSSGVI